MNEQKEPPDQNPRTHSKTPLVLAGIWLLMVIHRAYGDGSAGVNGLIAGTVRGCGTPGSLLIFPIMAYWFIASKYWKK
ncbi:MAG TPA: hypothetical protein VK815_00825 [Candidatus Acidoferrales bacterium]|nr:hypothetical protein [Candidatus Acidoferrales bacterium]